MHKNFWKDEALKGKLCFLAPMDGYGDSAYRQTMKRIAPHIYCISEFYSADGLIHSQFLADSVLPHSAIEKPLFIQIFGKDPDVFLKAAKIIEQYDIAGIDINMGCPAKKVVRSGHGSSLFINQDTAFKIIETLAKATHLPISVKTRLSFDGNQDLIEFAKGLENAGANMLTIHGRTAKQGYTGKADFSNIYTLKKHISIPLICNGDIEDYDDGMKKVKNLDGFMIGRKSFGNPWCFLPGGYSPSLIEILDIMFFHASALVETKGEKKGCLEIRKHLVQYLRNFPGVRTYRKKLVSVENIGEVKNVLDEIKNEFSDFLDKRPNIGEIMIDNFIPIESSIVEKNGCTL